MRCRMKFRIEYSPQDWRDVLTTSSTGNKTCCSGLKTPEQIVRDAEQQRVIGRRDERIPLSSRLQLTALV